MPASCSSTCTYGPQVLQLQTLAVVKPASSARACYHSWGVTVHPWVDETSRSSKTAQMDDTVVTGRGDLARYFVKDVLASAFAAARRRRSKKLFSVINLHEYERLFRDASKSVSSNTIDVSPHMLRHGGASTDALLKAMSFAELQIHGRWRRDRSVHRYEKHGRFLKMLNAMGEGPQRQAKRVLPTVVKRILNGLTDQLRDDKPQPKRVKHEL